MNRRSTRAIALAIVALFALAAPALADHDHGKSSQSHSKGSAQGTDGADAGTNGQKAESSDDGQKPFDEEPNDHPSGKDKSAESGDSGTQGKSSSDPDGMANGGADKPDEVLADGQVQGGFDDDHDGNNGCGNDDDFEDDNNGWCGKPEEAEPTTEVEGTTVADEPKKLATDTEPADEVLGIRVARAGSPDAVAATRDAIRPSTNAAVLPFTGLAVFPLVAAGLALMSLGGLVLYKSVRQVS